MATPAALPPNRKKELLGLLTDGESKTSACKILGISPSALRRALITDDEFAAEVQFHEDLKNEKVKEALFRRALGKSGEGYDGDVAAQKLWLTSRMPHEFANTMRHEHVGPGGGPVMVVHATQEALMSALKDREARHLAIDFIEGELLDEASDQTRAIEEGDGE
jgi:hypothetical protein